MKRRIIVVLVLLAITVCLLDCGSRDLARGPTFKYALDWRGQVSQPVYPV